MGQLCELLCGKQAKYVYLFEDNMVIYSCGEEDCSYDESVVKEFGADFGKTLKIGIDIYEVLSA